MSFKGLMLLADGFEDTEALATFDVLERGGLVVITATPNHNLLVTTARNHIVKAAINFKDIYPEDYDFLVIPGGPGISGLDKNKKVDELITDFVGKNKLVAAICAAPSLVGKLGFYQGHNYTCFPGFEEKITAGNHKDEAVVVSGNFITAKAMYYSLEFGLAIVQKLLGKGIKEKTFKNMKGE